MHQGQGEMPLIWSWVWGSVFNDEKSRRRSPRGVKHGSGFSERAGWVGRSGSSALRQSWSMRRDFFFFFALCVVIILSKTWFQIYSRLRWILSLSEGDLIVLFLKTWPLPFGLKTSGRAPQMALCLHVSASEGSRLWRPVSDVLQLQEHHVSSAGAREVSRWPRAQLLLFWLVLVSSFWCPLKQ